MIAKVEGASAPFSHLVPEIRVDGCGSNEDRISNIQRNCLRKIPRLTLAAEHGKSLVIAAYGPSLMQNLSTLKDDVKAGADVITVSGSHNYLIANGVIPDYHAEMDPRERKSEFLEKPHDDVMYLLASTCHPRTFDVVEGRKSRMWHLGEPATMDAVKKAEFYALIHPSVQAIGLNAIFLGHTLGYRHFILYGLDSSYLDGKTHTGWHNGEHEDSGRVTVRCGERLFDTRSEWIKYARNFVQDMIPHMSQLGCSFTIHGDGLLQHMLKEGLKEAA
jgi:hypothetical protein